MKQQLQTIRAGLENFTEPYLQKALTSLSELERMAGEPVAKVVLTEKLGLPCLQWLDLTRQFDFKGGEFLYAPPAQQPHERHLLNLLARIHGDGGHYTAEHGLEKSVSDADQKVADLHWKAWEAQQPRVGTIGHVSAGKTTLIAAVTPLLKAQQPQAEAVQACGHPMSLLLRSAESNEPLYCEACDDKSGRHDAERRETELLDVKRHLQEKIASADALKLHAIEELCQLGYTVKDGELIPPDHLHKLVEAAGHPLTAPQQAETVPSDVVRDAERWRMLPAYFHEYQIDAMKLYRDIDAAIAAQGEKP